MKNDKPEYLWMKVTEDVCETPIVTATSARALADMCGVSESAIRSSIWRNETGQTDKCIYRRVKIN